VQTGEKQSLACPLPACGFINTGRPEETALRRVVTSEADHALCVDGDMTGDRLARESDLTFADPIRAEGRADPREDEMLFRRERTTYLDILGVLAVEFGL